MIPKAPIAMPVRKKGYRWIRPELIAEITLRGWTHDEKLRHASYTGSGRTAMKLRYSPCPRRRCGAANTNRRSA